MSDEEIKEFIVLIVRGTFKGIKSAIDDFGKTVNKIENFSREELKDMISDDFYEKLKGESK